MRIVKDYDIRIVYNNIRMVPTTLEVVEVLRLLQQYQHVISLPIPALGKKSWLGCCFEIYLILRSKVTWATIFCCFCFKNYLI